MNKALLAITTLALLGGCGQKTETPDRTVQQLMADIVQPTADIYWKSVQWISDEEGMHEIVPKTDADWQRVRDAAVKLQELAVLLQQPAYSQDRGDDWIQISQSLAEVGELAEQAAVEKDVDKVFEVGGTIYNVCTACHQIYPATTGPEAEEAAQAGGAPAGS